jgi:hypothetical protein
MVRILRLMLAYGLTSFGTASELTFATNNFKQIYRQKASER